MAIIKRPEDGSGNAEYTPLISGGQVAAASDIGSQVTKIGEAVQKSGEQFFKLAEQSFKATAYNKAMSNATMMFNQAYEERVNKRFDDDGNPTYKSLVEDTGRMGRDIMNTMSANLFDLDVKQQFISNFGNHLNTRQLAALSESRQQHIDYSKTELAKVLKTNTEASFSDTPANVNYYVGQNEQIINEALKSGILSSQEAYKLTKDSRSEIRVGAYRKAIDGDPSKLLTQLENTDAQALGLDNKEREQLIKEAKAGVKDRETAAKKQIAEQEKVVKKAQNLYEKEQELKILRGELTEKQILEDVDKGRITETQGVELQIKLQRQVNQDEKEAVSLTEIEKAKETGEPLINVAPKLLDKSWKQDLELMAAQRQGEPITLVDGAIAASKINAVVPAFKKELEFNLLNEQGTDPVNSLKAWEHMKTTRPAGIATVSKKAQAVADFATVLTRNTNVTEQQAMAMARNAVLNKDDFVVEQRRKELRDINAFKIDKLESTIIDDVFDEFDFKRNWVAPQDQAIFSQLFEQNYIMTGDKDAAVEMAKTQTKGIFGKTVVNDTSFIGKDQLMFFPPEFLFQNRKPETIKTAWLSDRKTLADLNNVDEEKIGILADDVFKSLPFEKKSYLVINKETTQPLYLPNGDIARWRPTEEELDKAYKKGK